MILFKPMGWLFLGVAGLFYISALTAQSGLLFLLIGLVLGCFLLNLLGSIYSTRNVDISCPQEMEIEENGVPREKCKVVNRGWFHLGIIRINQNTQTILEIPFLRKKHQETLPWAMAKWKRGHFTLSEAFISSEFPFGLLEYRRPFPLPGQIWVYPKLYPTPSPPAAGWTAMVGGKLTGRNKSNSGSLFHGIRPMVEGDSFRQIDWKSTARGQGLMIKVYEEELSGRISMILLTQPTDVTEIVDHAVRCAGSLLFAALDAGHHVEWLEADSQEVPLVLAPFDDPKGILQRLAMAKRSGKPLSPKEIVTLLEKFSRKSSIVVVSTFWNKDLAMLMDDAGLRGRVTAAYVPEETSVDKAYAEHIYGYYGADHLRPA